MSQEDIFSLIARVLEGQADSSEMASFRQWIDNSSENKQYFEQILNIWQVSGYPIDPKKINILESLKKVNKGILKAQPGAESFFWKRLVAILLIPLLIANLLWFVFQFKSYQAASEVVYHEVNASFGTRTSLKLNDGSVVWLNSGSSIRYPERFIGRERKIYLEGEAYFEVNSDESKPFIVETSNLNVKATGTKFNISDYQADNSLAVTLVTGKVTINKLLLDGREAIISTLNPNQHFIYNKESSKSAITVEDSYIHIAWKDGKLIFRDAPLTEVIKKLGMVFNADVETRGIFPQDYRYWATFQDESLSDILKLLKLSAPLDYVEVKRKPLPDRSFPQKQIIVYARKDNY